MSKVDFQPVRSIAAAGSLRAVGMRHQQDLITEQMRQHLQYIGMSTNCPGNDAAMAGFRTSSSCQCGRLHCAVSCCDVVMTLDSLHTWAVSDL